MASIFAQGTPRAAVVQFATANTNLDGTGTIATLIAGAASPGSIVIGVRFKAMVATTLGMIRVYYYNGTNTRLIDEIPVPPITISGAQRTTWQYDWTPPFPLKLASASEELRASTHVAETFNATITVGDL